MASWLVLDWDQDHFHILCAQSARHGVAVTRAASWPHPEPFTPSTAERVGKALRDYLKSAHIAAAPVLFGLGRDRIFLKELRFPELAAHEEANLVRFQTGKELTESVENYAVDYAPLAKLGVGERQVMTVAARRDIVAMIQTLCQAAGLKLHAITPKLFGVAQALDRAVRPEESPLKPNTLNAVLAVGWCRWAELCFFRGRRLLQVQSLANGPMLVSEIKRSLAVFQAQHAVDVDLSGPDCLFVFGDSQAAVQSADNGHRLPIRLLDPLGQEPEIAKAVKNPACFAGAVGLADLWASGGKPVNLAAPKKQSAPRSVSKQRGIFYGAAAAVVLLLACAGMYMALSRQRSEMKDLNEVQAAQDKFLKDFAQERADLDAYKEWDQTTVAWLDEMYDLSARFPWEKDFRVNQFVATSTGKKAAKDSKDSKDKDNFIGKINLNGYSPSGKDKELVKELTDSMSRDTHVKPVLKSLKHGVNAAAPTVYDMKIDLAKQNVSAYTTFLIVPPVPIGVIEPAKDPEPMAEEGDDQ